MDSRNILNLVLGKESSVECPRCNLMYEGYSALSRRDNQTDICSSCGQEEALIDAGYIDSTENEKNFLRKLGLI